MTTAYSSRYLAFIRKLPCLICHKKAVAAHVRYADALYGKRKTGAAEKPSDYWAIPLCDEHHTHGQEAQHNSGERVWWLRHKIDPLMIAGLLTIAYLNDDESAASVVCYNAETISKKYGY